MQPDHNQTDNRESFSLLGTFNLGKDEHILREWFASSLCKEVVGWLGLPCSCVMAELAYFGKCLLIMHLEWNCLCSSQEVEMIGYVLFISFYIKIFKMSCFFFFYKNSQEEYKIFILLSS